MRLKTAKKAHGLIEKLNHTRQGVDRLDYVLRSNIYCDDFKPEHKTKMLAYYATLLGDDLWRVEEQIEKL